MGTIALAFAEAGAMVARGDPKLVEIVALSLQREPAPRSSSQRWWRFPSAPRSP